MLAAQMGLLPDQWWSMTPREFNLYAEGHKERTEYEMERLAWHAVNIINSIPHLGKGRRKAVTVDDLMGRKKPIAASAEEFKAQLQARYERREQEMDDW